MRAARLSAKFRFGGALFGGGVSDKFGNIYEAYWAVRQLLDVIRGPKQMLRLEGISKEFNGFEFVVDEGHCKSWHQTKINAQGQNWTVRALQREGVLNAFSARMSAAANDRCVFVSQSPAVDISDLSGKASYSTDFTDFDQALDPTPRSKFVDFHTVAGIDPGAAFELLRRCDFRTLPQEEIKASVENFSSLLFDNEPDKVFPVLRGYLEDRLNRDLTTDLVREEIPAETELRFKDWSLRPTIRSKLKSENDSYLESYIPFGASGHLVKRPQGGEVISLLEDAAGPGVIMIAGIAGSGKSGIVRDLMQDLADRGVLHLAFRVDHHLDCKSPADFGNSVLGTAESPATVLKGLSPNELSVLVIDQLDAISEISGRNGVTRNAILRIIEEARRYSSVRVVLVCRTFDIENDERIKLLKQRNDFRQVDVPLLHWKNDVAPLLESLGVHVERFEESQRELLCLPLNLAVFAEVAGGAETQFSSRNDLFEKLLTKKERAMADHREPPSWPLMTPLRALSDWMSSRQRLDAPVGVLDDYKRSADILSSEHLIARSRGTVSFFHESFFDYVFARSFAAKARSLVDLLTSSEQHLFRRTQVRQVLESLRQSDFPRYLDELEEILSSTSVRFHIKVAVAKWLAALASPTGDERDIVLALDLPDSPFPMLVRDAIMGTGGWFDVLVENGWLSRQLESGVEPRERALLWWLEKIAGDRPEAVADLLENWWHGDQERGAKLLDWFGYMRNQKAATALVGLCRRLIASRPSNLFVGNDLRRELLIARWTAGESADDAALILKAYFNAWFEKHPGEQPFARDVFKEMDTHSLSELGKRSPLALLEGSIDALVRTFEQIGAKEASGERDYTFYFREMGTTGFGADRFIQMMRTALQKVARSDPATARSLLNRIDPGKHEVAIHLHLETMIANPEELADLLRPLLLLPQLLDAGWEGARWKSFADVAGAALPHLQDSDRRFVEDFILNQWPEIDFAAEVAADALTAENQAKERRYAMYYLSRSGHRQFCILHTIGPERLGAAARRRLAELGRKFGTEDVEEPTRIRVSMVDSPISDKRARHMSDQNWLDAITHYNGERKSDRQDRRIGGARQLANVLKAAAQAEPARFALLLKRISANTNHAYIASLLQGLVESETVDFDSLSSAVLLAHQWNGRPFGEIICRAFYNHAELCEAHGCWSALLWYAENGSASESQELSDTYANNELVTIEHLLERGGRLYIRGVSSVRGWALEALTQVLWHVPSRTSEAWGFLESRVIEETDLSVRCCLVDPLTPMFNVDKVRCATLLESLVDHSPVHDSGLFALLTRPATGLMPYIVHQVPDTGRRLLHRMAASSDERIRLVAAWHIMRTSYHDTAYLNWADELEVSDLDAKLLAADIASSAIEEATFRERSIEKVRAFFDDGDEGVRKKAAEVFRYIGRDQQELVNALAGAFLASEAFADESFAFLHFLEEAQVKVSELVVMAAEKVIADLRAPSESSGKHDMALHQLHELLNREYVNSEREPELRKRLLDVVDQMLVLDLRGVDELFKKHER